MAQSIQTPVPGQLLRNEFGLRGRVELQLGEEIIPVVNIADLARGAGLPLRRTVVARFAQAAVAGEYFVFQLVTPPNVIAALKRLVVWSDTAQQINFHHGNALAAAPASAVHERFTDGRLLQPDFINPSVFPTYGTAAVGLGANYEETYRLDVAYYQRSIDLEHVIVGAGDSRTYGYWEFAASTVNSGVTGALIWQEHAIG